MMLLAIARSVDVVANAADFEKMSSDAFAYLANGFTVEKLTPVAYSQSFLDCRNFTISSSAQLFGSVYASSLRNCNFRLTAPLASDFNQVEFTNVRIEMAAAVGVSAYIVDSSFVGVQFSVQSTIALNVTRTLFAGSVFALSSSGGAEDVSLFAALTSVQLTNSHVNCSVQTAFAGDIAGVAHTASDFTLQNSRIVVDLESQGYIEGSAYLFSLGAVFGELSGVSSIIDVDFVVNLTTSTLYDNIGSVAAQASVTQLVFSNASLYNNLYLDMASQTGADAAYVSIGALAVMKNCGTTTVQNISVFSDSRIDCSFSKGEIAFGALIGSVATSNVTFANCYSLGSIYINVSTAEAVAGGLLGDCQTSKTVSNSAFNGNLTVLIKTTTNTAVGGFVGQTSASVSNCYAINALLVKAESNGVYYIGGLVGLALSSGAIISKSYGAQSITTQLAYTSGQLNLGGLVGKSFAVADSFVESSVTLYQQKGTFAKVNLAGFVAVAGDNISNSSTRANITVTAVSTSFANNFVAAFIASNQAKTVHANLFVNSSIYMPSSRTANVSSVVGNVSATCKLSSAIIAVTLRGVSSVKYYAKNNSLLSYSNLRINCDLSGNDDDQDECSSRTQSNYWLSELGSAFAYDSGYNNKYPYIAALPVYSAGKFILPSSGAFAKSNYIVDAKYLPFPIYYNYICRGACKGRYSSPASFTCLANVTDAYCIKIEQAILDFPNECCFLGESICEYGLSRCQGNAELETKAGVFECVGKCSECVGGFCAGGVCQCDIYYQGSRCEIYNCSIDQPVCFADTSFECASDNSECIAASACSTIDCGHGTCVEEPAPHCVCEGLWSGSSCRICTGYSADCNMTQAECDATCSGHGTCKTPQTTTCTCDASHSGSNCLSCAPGYFLAECVTADICGRTTCNKKGYCVGDKLSPSCKCSGNWQGSDCSICGAFGANCDITAEECAETCCEGKEECNEQCAGSSTAYACECTIGRFGQQCDMDADQCAALVCGGHGTCKGGKNVFCQCDAQWYGAGCATCGGFGVGCTMTPEQCAQTICNDNGQCSGAWEVPDCACNPGFDPESDCTACRSGMQLDGKECFCGSAGVICATEQYCSDGVCARSCMAIPHCLRCNDPNFAVCDVCDNGLAPSVDGLACKCGAADCGDDEFCSGAVCKPTCKSIAQCLECDSADLGLCARCGSGLSPSAGGSRCACGEAAEECQTGSYCAEGKCVPMCQTAVLNCTACDKVDLRQCAECADGFSLADGKCEKSQKKSGTLVAVAIGVGCSLAALVVVVLAILLAKRARARKVSQLVRGSSVNESPRDDSLKDVLSGDDLTFQAPKALAVPLKAPAPLNLVDTPKKAGQAKRKVKKIILRREDDPLVPAAAETLELSRMKQSVKLEPIRYCGRDQYV